MAAKAHEKPAAPEDTQARQQVTGMISRQILRSLGQPDDLRAIDVRWLFANCYRANVVVGGDATSVKIPHSYFLKTDTDGTILASNPQITRVYGTEEASAG